MILKFYSFHFFADRIAMEIELHCICAHIFSLFLHGQCSKKSRPTVALLLQLVVALWLLNLFFVVGVDRVENSSVCAVMGVALHYLTLAALSWLVALFVYVGVATCYGGWGKCLSSLTSVITWGELSWYTCISLPNHGRHLTRMH